MCEICKDSGYIFKGKEYAKCKCTIQKELDSFLRQYKDYQGDRKYCRFEFVRDMIFLEMSEDTFGGIAKSMLAYLYVNNNSLTWEDFTGIDLISINFDRDESYINKDVYTLDFVILRIGRDTKNCILGDVLTNCITRRRELGNVTWIYQYPNTSVTRLRELYGESFINFIRQPDFKALKGA